MSAIVGGADACRCAVALTSSVMSKRNGSQRTLLNTYVKYVHRRSELSRWAQRAQTAAERHTGTLLSWRRQRRVGKDVFALPNMADIVKSGDISFSHAK